MTCRLFCFNPEHDYALASFSPYYTAPAKVVALAKDLWSLPAAFAAGSDALLYPSDIDISSPQHLALSSSLSERGITLVPDSPEAVAHFLEDCHQRNITVIPTPWGWNPAVRHKFQLLGLPDDSLPSDEALLDIRRLSDRRFAAEFNRLMAPSLSLLLGYDASPAAEIFTKVEDAMAFHSMHPDCWIKAPWSSSGRGVIYCGDLEIMHIEPWVRGIIRRQGCVTAETNAPRILDFASEWICYRDAEGDHADFLGWSVFRTSSRGKYHNNVAGTQPQLQQQLETVIPPAHLPIIIEAQRAAILQSIAPYYSGPLGIDMLADPSGHVRACVEINLRHTMGHISLHPSLKGPLSLPKDEK